MSHNRVRVDYPISASKLVQCDASAGVSDPFMSVSDDELNNETLLREDYWMLEVFRELLRVSQSTTNTNESILVQEGIEAIQGTRLLDFRLLRLRKLAVVLGICSLNLL